MNRILVYLPFILLAFLCFNTPLYAQETAAGVSSGIKTVKKNALSINVSNLAFYNLLFRYENHKNMFKAYCIEAGIKFPGTADRFDGSIVGPYSAFTTIMPSDEYKVNRGFSVSAGRILPVKNRRNTYMSVEGIYLFRHFKEKTFVKATGAYAYSELQTKIKNTVGINYNFGKKIFLSKLQKTAYLDFYAGFGALVHLIHLTKWKNAYEPNPVDPPPPLIKSKNYEIRPVLELDIGLRIGNGYRWHNKGKGAKPK